MSEILLWLLAIESIGIVSKVSSFLLLCSAGVYPFPLLILKSIDKFTLPVIVAI